MARNEDGVTPKTLADAVGQPPVSETPTASAVVGANGIRVSDVTVDYFDINTPLDEDGAATVTTDDVQSEATVDTSIRLGLGRPDTGLAEPKSNGGVSLGTDIDVSLVHSPKNGDKGNVDRMDSAVFDKTSNGDAMNQGDGGGMNAAVVDKARNGDVGHPGIEDLNGDVEIDGVNKDNDTVDSIEEHGYSVGDLVWGKIKSHPWWPGQIYDLSDASTAAVRYNQKGRLLVAYYGDGTFAWCLPSQLVPFAEHFEEMSKQNGSKNFVSAVEEAVNEIGRLVDLEMTCSCVPDKNRKGLERVPVVNGGIKPGVLAPVGGIGKLLSFRYDPSELLATVANTAETVSFASMLELSILKGWLSSFYRARGGDSLPQYHEPVLVEGLDDKSETNAIGATNFGVTGKVSCYSLAEDEWDSFTAAGPGNGPAPQEDNILNGRKQKSMAELLAAGTDATPENGKRMNSAVEGNVSNIASKKRKANEEDGNRSNMNQDIPTRRRRGRKVEDNVSGYRISKPGNGVAIEEKLQGRSLSSKLLKVDIPGENNEGDGAKSSEATFSPRERKKSKYLSPPYTSPRSSVGYPSYKDEERESEKIAKITRVGERMTNAAVQLLDYTPSKSNGKPCEKEVSGGYSRKKAVESADLIPETGKEVQFSIIYELDANSALDEVLSGLKSLAAGPLPLLNVKMLELIREFIYAFRSTTYLNGANYKIYHRTRQGRKKESWNLEHGNPVDDLNQTGIDSPADQGRGKKPKKNPSIPKEGGEEKSGTPKPKRLVRCSGKKANLKEGKREAPLASSLVLTFSPAIPLPSKDEIIRSFSKFGDIKENETIVIPDSHNVEIVYMNAGCAEEALKASLSGNAFGSVIIEYKLRYSSDPPETVQSSPMTSSLPKEAADRSVAAESASEGMPQLGSIRQKLENMTSMLEKFQGKFPTQVISSLDGDINSIFEKVRTIAEEASS